MKPEKSHDHPLPAGVLALAADADGATLFAACMDGTIREVDAATGKRADFRDAHTSFASGIALTPDGTTLISAGYDGALCWHDRAARKLFRRVQAHDFWSWRVALSPDGRLVASSTGQYLAGGWKYEPAPERESSVRVFDARTGDPVASLSHGPPVLSLTFSPDGRHLAAANMLGEIRIWETANFGNPVAAWMAPDFTSWGRIKSHHYCGGIYDLKFAPDGRSLLACGMGPMTDPMAGNGKMTWQRWDWTTDPPARTAAIGENDGGSGLMEALAFNPGGSHFVMAGRQAQGTWNAALFDAGSGALVHSVDTGNRVTAARFAPDGTRLFLGCANGQGHPDKDGVWPEFGRIQVWKVS